MTASSKNQLAYFQVSTPSNIAFIKYWGKKDLPSTTDENKNLPLNPSLSLTLSKARTTTRFGKLDPTSPTQKQLQLKMNGLNATEKDVLKVQAHVERILVFLKIESPAQNFFVDTENNFPMGTGLASSASAFSALTLAVLGYFWGAEKLKQELNSRLESLSALARRGSGSACRSLSGPFVLWSDFSAQTLEQKSWKLFDTIVIFSKTHKRVPSSDGHKSAQSSPLFPIRLDKIPQRLKDVQTAINSKDLALLGNNLELEADELHKIAETGTPSITYAAPETTIFLNALKKISHRDFYYTLDAGPNVHLISERPIEKEIQHLLKSLGLNAEIWSDESGTGPQF
jgi:diphosphomevalonate decarboxylase